MSGISHSSETLGQRQNDRYSGSLWAGTLLMVTSPPSPQAKGMCADRNGKQANMSRALGGCTQVSIDCIADASERWSWCVDKLETGQLRPWRGLASLDPKRRSACAVSDPRIAVASSRRRSRSRSRSRAGTVARGFAGAAERGRRAVACFSPDCGSELS
jgi:hypothetical protein